MSFLFSLFLGSDSRSRGARAPWFVRSVDIFSSAVGSSAQLYLCGFRSLLTLLAFFTILLLRCSSFCCHFLQICYITVDIVLCLCYCLLDNKQLGVLFMKISELKKGDFFKLSENGCVYVRDSYDRSSKKYECYKYDDINAFRYLKGSKEVITDFIF